MSSSWIKRKQQLGAVLQKGFSTVCCRLRIWCVLNSATSADQKSCSVESRGTLAKIGFLYVSLPGILWHSGFLSRRLTQSVLAKLGIAVKIYLFSSDFEVCLCCICLLTWKMMPFFLIFSKLTGSYLQWPAKSKWSVE